MATNNAVNVGLSGATGTGNFVGSISSTITTPKIVTGIFDINGNEILGLTPSVSAVNTLSINNSATGAALGIAANGSDTNIIMTLTGKGTGGVQVGGTTSGDNASPGFVGQFISSVIPSGTPVSLTTITPANITSLSLLAGDYDIWGNVGFLIGGNCIVLEGWISSVSASPPDASLISILSIPSGIANGTGFCVPQLRFNLSAPTTIYLSADVSFSTSTVDAYGGIYARRIR